MNFRDRRFPSKTCASARLCPGNSCQFANNDTTSMRPAGINFRIQELACRPREETSLSRPQDHPILRKAGSRAVANAKRQALIVHLKIAGHPPSYQIVVSAPGVIKFTTMPDTRFDRFLSGASVPARATPTSISTFAGSENWQICQRSHFSCDFRFAAQDGGGSMSYIQRVGVPESSVVVALIGAATNSCWPMLVGYTGARKGRALDFKVPDGHIPVIP